MRQTPCSVLLALATLSLVFSENLFDTYTNTLMNAYKTKIGQIKTEDQNDERNPDETTVKFKKPVLEHTLGVRLHPSCCPAVIT